MSLYFIFGLMTLAAIFMVLLPLGRRSHGPSSSDADVYRAQLAEIERGHRLGAVTAEEAGPLRAEVARRLLTATDRAAPEPAGGAVARRRIAALVAVIGIPLVAIPVYAIGGHPNLSDQPLAQRMAPPPPRLDETSMLIARVEKVLERKPDDGRGWDVLAPVYLRIGRAQDAATAYATAIRLMGSTPEREVGHAEALTIAAQGNVTAEARDALGRAISADAGNPRARYFLARARAQDGDRAGAADDLRVLLREGPADAPWRAFVERALAEFEGPS